MYVQTKRLELKPIRTQDLPALAELLTDEVVKQTYMVPDFPTREDALPMADRIRSLSEAPDRYVSGIYLGQQLIGLLNETEIQGDRIELGYAILPRFHNQGYGTEALSAAIDYFLSRGFREVLTGAFEENAASIRIMVKSGMTKSEQQDTVTYRGNTHRCVYYFKRILME